MARGIRGWTFLLLAALASPAAAGAPFLLVPRGDGPLPAGKVPVLGRAGVDSGLARLEVNGKLAGFAGVKDGVFFAPVLLPEGTSTLRVTAGSWTGEAVLRASSSGAWRSHPALEECDRCHGAATGRKGTGLYAVVPPVEKACAPCHPGKGAGKHVHGPAALGQCTACHDPHGSPFPALAKDGRRCFSCHDPFPPGESLHRPATDGRCHACHDPHASPHPAHLKREGNLLCRECHREDGYHEIHRKAPQEGSTAPPLPEDFPRSGEDPACTGCHAPHRSAKKALLREEKDLCRKCHSF